MLIFFKIQFVCSVNLLVNFGFEYLTHHRLTVKRIVRITGPYRNTFGTERFDKPLTRQSVKFVLVVNHGVNVIGSRCCTLVQFDRCDTGIGSKFLIQVSSVFVPDFVLLFEFFQLTQSNYSLVLSHTNFVCQDERRNRTYLPGYRP